MNMNTAPAATPAAAPTTDLTWMNVEFNCETKAERLYYQASNLRSEARHAGGMFLMAGPHALYYFGKPRRYVNARDFQALNDVLREAKLIPEHKQMTQAMHYMLVAKIECDAINLERRLIDADEQTTYRRLLKAMPDFNLTAIEVENIFTEFGEEILNDDSPFWPKAWDWQYDLVDEVTSAFQNLKALKPRPKR